LEEERKLQEEIDRWNRDRQQWIRKHEKYVGLPMEREPVRWCRSMKSLCRKRSLTAKKGALVRKVFGRVHLISDMVEL
jgi:hypothetical protein